MREWTWQLVLSSIAFKLSGPSDAESFNNDTDPSVSKQSPRSKAAQKDCNRYLHRAWSDIIAKSGKKPARSATPTLPFALPLLLSSSVSKQLVPEFALEVLIGLKSQRIPRCIAERETRQLTFLDKKLFPQNAVWIEDME